MTCLTTKQVLKDKQTRDINSITSLALTHQALSDVSCLSQFKNLERLDLTFNNLTSLEGLRGCINLKWLSVVQNKLQSLDGIETLSKLTVLNAGKNMIKSMEPVTSLVSLRALILNDNEVSSICKLNPLKELNTLVLSRNPISEIGESLDKVKSITKLSLSNCHIEKIDSSLRSCVELKELRLAHNEIKTLPAELVNNKKLLNLDLGNNVITRWSEVKVLGSLVNLRNLNLQGNPVAEKDKIVKKVQTLLPNLHVFNAKPINKDINGRNSRKAGVTHNVPQSSEDEQEILKGNRKDNVRETSNYEIGRDNTGRDSRLEDSKKKKKHEKAKRPRKFEEQGNGKDVYTVEKNRKRKNSQEEVANDIDVGPENLEQKKTDEELFKNIDSGRKDNEDTSGKKSKSKKLRKNQDELDMVDNDERSFTDLFGGGAVQSLKHDGKLEKGGGPIGGTMPESGVVTVSVKKKQLKNQVPSDTVQSSSTAEVGLGGPSTWCDDL